MFDPYCTTCRSRVLAGYRQLRSVDNTLDGIVLRFTCVCGGEAVLVTGRLAEVRARSAPASLDGGNASATARAA